MFIYEKSEGLPQYAVKLVEHLIKLADEAKLSDLDEDFVDVESIVTDVIRSGLGGIQDAIQERIDRVESTAQKMIHVRGITEEFSILVPRCSPFGKGGSSGCISGCLSCSSCHYC